ncbi:tail completion protein gp17 [Novosphingobium gossypii]|uniref:tail completion protein gp17 n=1 Tax=Novosphingobium gossypii TaxID=1604774 RepID=UPI003D243869
MSFEADLRKRLLDDAAVDELAAGKVHWALRPDGEEPPSVVLLVVSDNRGQHLEGFHSLWDTRVQLDCYGARHTDACALRDAVIACIAPYAVVGGTRFDHAEINNVMDRGEDAPSSTAPIKFIHRQMIDATFWRGKAGA